MRVAKAAEKILCHPLPVLFFDMSMISSKKPFMMTLRLMIYLATIDVLYVKKMPILALF